MCGHGNGTSIAFNDVRLSCELGVLLYKYLLRMEAETMPIPAETMPIPNDRYQVIRQLAYAIFGECGAKKYFSLLATISHSEENRRVFKLLADEHIPARREK